MYPNPDGSSYPKAGNSSSSKNTTGDYGANAPDPKRSAGGPDALTQAVLDALTGGKPITTKTTE
jgi:hypothetical protein